MNAVSLSQLTKLQSLPFSVTAIADLQTVKVFSAAEKGYSGKMMCSEGNSPSQSDVLFNSIQHGQGAPVSSEDTMFTMEISEMAKVNQITCFYLLNGSKYSVVSQPIIKDMFGLPLANSFTLLLTTSTKALISVSTTYPSMVWCKVSNTVPRIAEMKTVKGHFVEKRGTYEITGLTPNTKYSAYCYVEGMNQIAMSRTVESTKMSFTTKKEVATEKPTPKVETTTPQPIESTYKEKPTPKVETITSQPIESTYKEKPTPKVETTTSQPIKSTYKEKPTTSLPIETVSVSSSHPRHVQTIIIMENDQPQKSVITNMVIILATFLSFMLYYCLLYYNSY